MEERTCPDCGHGFTKTPGPGRWASRCDCCRNRRRPLTPEQRSQSSRDAVAVRWANDKRYEIQCDVCGEAFEGRASNARFCSQACRSLAAYRRKRSDPTRWAEYVDGLRVRYADDAEFREHRRKSGARQRLNRGVKLLYDGTVKACEWCEVQFTGTYQQRFCTPACRRKASWQREKGRIGLVETVIMGMASLHGAYFPKTKPIKVRVTVGVMATCPWCAAFMTATDSVHRVCLECGTTLELNAEEVSWAISEKRSIEASLRTAS